LNFQRPEIINLASFVVSAQNNINISRRATFGILQTHFGQRCPFGICPKEKFCRIVCNQPLLPKTNWASDDDFVFMENTANAEWVLRFVFGAVRNFIIERAKTFCAMPVCIGTHVCCRKTEDFCQWMLGFHLIIRTIPISLPTFNSAFTNQSLAHGREEIFTRKGGSP